MRPKGGAAKLEEGASEGEEEEEEEDDDDDEQLDALPDTVKRHCTDVSFLLVFILGHTLLSVVVRHVWKHGSVRREISLEESNGDGPCGYGINFADPYLFFCVNRTNTTGDPNTTGVELSRNFAVCVGECPASSANSRRCQGVDVPEYETVGVMGMLCLPKEEELRAKVKTFFKTNFQAKVVIRFHMLTSTWAAHAASAILAVSLFLVYVAFLSWCASYLVWALFIILTVVPLCLGAYFMNCWYAGGCNETFLGLADTNPGIELFSGVVLLSMGLAFLYSNFHRGESIGLAVECLEAACDCFRQNASLQVVPMIALLSRSVVILFYGWMCLLILSCGHHLDPKDSVMLFRGLITIRTAFSPLENFYIGVLLVMFFWDIHLMNTILDYVTMFLTELWFFYSHEGEGTMPRFALCKAYYTVFRYHLGTLCLGALVLGITALPRAVLGVIADQARTAHNPVTLLLSAVCCLCVRVFEDCLAPFAKDAYMQLCIGPGRFREVANRALVLVRSEDEAVKILNGVTWLFQLGALVGICLLAHTMVLAIVTHFGAFTEPRSPYYVYNKEVVAVAGSVMAFTVVLPFMMALDTVSDTIIFCYSVRKVRLSRTFGGAMQSAARYFGCLGSSIPCFWQGPASVPDEVPQDLKAQHR